MSTKKPSAAQLAAREKFAARARAGTLKRTGAKKRSYTGKYPKRIKTVTSAGPRGVVAVTLNDGSKLDIKASDTGGVMPHPGEDISRYMKNPLSRVKVNSPPQRPKGNRNKPSTRLVKRRRRTAKAPEGYYANPVVPQEMRQAGSAGLKATKATLKKKLELLSKAIGAPAWEHGKESSIGAIGLDVNPSYGGYRLVQLRSASGAESDLSDRLPAAQMLAFLDGALMVARAVK